MRLAIADPPYPPHRSGKRRASRWYGDAPLASDDVPADVHQNAHEWDSPGRHRELLCALQRAYDGWAIATPPDGLGAYEPLPTDCRIMAWVRPNAMPGAHRLLSRWEAVIVLPPDGRRSNRGGASVNDVLVAPVPGSFTGEKPREWTHWVLDALGYDQDADEVVDLFPGSGAVRYAVDQLRLFDCGRARE